MQTELSKLSNFYKTPLKMKSVVLMLTIWAQFTKKASSM